MTRVESRHKMGDGQEGEEEIPDLEPELGPALVQLQEEHGPVAQRLGLRVGHPGLLSVSVCRGPPLGGELSF